MHTLAPDYSEKPDEDLLRLALEPDSLTPDAQIALRAELKKRELDSPSQLASFSEEQKASQHLQDIDLGQLGLGPHGMGKRLYGKTNAELAGGCEEYDATLFAVIAFFPLVPIGTYRISREQGSKQPMPLDKRPLNWGQIVWVWLRAIFIVIAIPFLLDLFLRVTK